MIKEVLIAPTRLMKKLMLFGFLKKANLMHGSADRWESLKKISSGGVKTECIENKEQEEKLEMLKWN